MPLLLNAEMCRKKLHKYVGCKYIDGKQLMETNKSQSQGGEKNASRRVGLEPTTPPCRCPTRQADGQQLCDSQIDHLQLEGSVTCMSSFVLHGVSVGA